MSKLYRVFNKIDTVEGFCEECGEQTNLSCYRFRIL
jgi:hypothetical protein